MKIRMITFSVLAVMSFAGMTTTVMAQEERYDCSLTERSNRGPVPEKIDIILDTQRNTAKVQDIFTRQLFKNPLSAQLEIINPQKVEVRWKLTGLSYDGSETRVTGGVVDYKISLNRRSKGITLTGISREYFSQIYGQGKCNRVK